MKIYRYRFFRVWLTGFGALLWILFSLWLLTTLWSDFFTDSPVARPISELLPLSLAMVFAVVIGMYMLNMFPDVAVRDDGFSVRCFLVIWLFVPWRDVIAVNPSLASISGHIYLVQVKRLTFVHNLIGLTQGLSLRPGFLIAPGIEGYKELLQLIRKRTANEARLS